MRLYDIALAIREVGQIWLIDFPAYGTLFRAEIGKKQFQVVVPKPGIDPAEVPQEKNSLLCVATSLSEVKKFLHDLIK